MLCARFNVISIYLKISGWKKWMVCLGSVVLAIAIRVVFSNSPASMKVDFVVVPLFILPLVTLIEGTNLVAILQFLAKHSTNIWLTHTFWCYYFGQKIVLLPRYSVFIYLWLLLLAVLSSYVINLLYIPFCNLVFGKDHKLSLDGYLNKKTK